jgi:beta-galactosidase
LIIIPNNGSFLTAAPPKTRSRNGERDAELMAAAGINVVRIGEFSWGLCEPEDGKFDFGWLKRVMDVLGERGIQVVLGTPTAAPPIWLAKNIRKFCP